MAGTDLKVTELDFADIKTNLKNYLKNQSTFNDYDFEGSGLSVLLDVLAYNTHYNAMTAHLALNEAFLDSAQIRGNVVARARMLSYVPRSILSPRSSIQIVVQVGAESGTLPATLTLNRGAKLTSIVDGEEFNFIVLNTQTASLVVTDASNKTYTFDSVEIAEGTYKTAKYRVDNSIENQKFQIADKDVDTSTLRVRVQANEESSAFDIYTLFTTLLNVVSDTKIYHLQENANGFYETYFGDGVTGFKPTNNNIVTMDYVFSNATEANGATTFTMVDSIGGYSNISVTTLTNAAGGSDQETLESIRFNAPLTFTSQNRAVTADDYRSIIQREFSNISAISTWGGEDNDPPNYGNVFVCIKPVTSNVLTTAEKENITTNILKGKNVVSITPILVDPNFTNLSLEVFFKYNPNLTDRSSVELTAVVRDTIDDYSLNELNKFDGVFRHSQLTNEIDNSDPSILNSTIRPRMFQNFTPLTDTDGNIITQNHTLTFAGKFLDRGSSAKMLLSSSPFKLNGSDTSDHFFGDIAIDNDSTKRTVIVYKVSDGKNVSVIADAGLIDIANGIITLNNFLPTTNSPIRVSVIPDSLDIAPKREQLLDIEQDRVEITPEIDTIATAGSSGSITYTTTSRLKD